MPDANKPPKAPESGAEAVSRAHGSCEPTLLTHEHPQPESERQFSTFIPSGQKVGAPWHDSGFKDAEQEAHAACLGTSLNERSANRADSKAKSCCGQEPTWADDLAANRCRDLEDDIRDVEDRQDHVVIVALQVKVPLEAGKARIACHFVSSAITIVEGHPYQCSCDQ